MKEINAIKKFESDFIDDVVQGTGGTFLIVKSEDLIEFAKTYAHYADAKQTIYQEKPEVEKPITQQEACKFLGRSRQTLINWRRNGYIEAHRLGGRIYYMPSELLKALKKEK